MKPLRRTVQSSPVATVPYAAAGRPRNRSLFPTLAACTSTVRGPIYAFSHHAYLQHLGAGVRFQQSRLVPADTGRGLTIVGLTCGVGPSPPAMVCSQGSAAAADWGGVRTVYGRE